ncbi:MAG: helix-turn-helix transcriptional regulator [Clostridia bacterium]|nr:helix-turn-helix transcriptional regulator [Clostridia bacterium]
MEIKKASIKSIQKGFLSSTTCEGIQHIKISPLPSIVQAVEGSYDIKLGDGEMMNTGEGGFFIAPSNVQQTIVHHIDPESGRMRARWIFFDVLINDDLRFDSLFVFPAVADEKAKTELNECFDILFGGRGVLEECAAFYKTLSILSTVGKPRGKQRNNPVYRAIDLIEKNYSSVLTVSDLAKAACTSESNLYAIFKKNFGISPIAYLNRYRLSAAGDMLTETDLSISSIAAKTGFNDPLYFSKMFKKTFGSSPRNYRNMLK